MPAWILASAIINTSLGIVAVVLLAVYSGEDTNLVGDCFIIFAISYPVNAALELGYLAAYYQLGGSFGENYETAGDYVQQDDDAPIAV